MNGVRCCWGASRICLAGFNNRPGYPSGLHAVHADLPPLCHLERSGAKSKGLPQHRQGMFYDLIPPARACGSQSGEFTYGDFTRGAAFASTPQSLTRQLSSPGERPGEAFPSLSPSALNTHRSVLRRSYVGQQKIPQGVIASERSERGDLVLLSRTQCRFESTPRALASLTALRPLSSQ